MSDTVGFMFCGVLGRKILRKKVLKKFGVSNILSNFAIAIAGWSSW